MKRLIVFASLFLSIMLYVCFTQNSNSSRLFKKITPPFNQEVIVTDPQALLACAQSTLNFIIANEKKEWAPLSSPIFSQFGITLDDVKRTLRFIIQTIKQDSTKKKQRILDPAFINKHFNVISWSGDKHDARAHKVKLGSGAIRLTYYLVFRMPGSYKKTKEHPYALYAVPEEEKSLSDVQIEQKKTTLIRFKYTKQDVINGILHNKKVRPLIWLSREGIEEALLQGTISVTLPDGKQRLFNVDKCNDIPYDRSIKDKYAQKRYWYFKEVDSFYGFKGKVESVPGISLAGDVYNLGLGKLIALKSINKETDKPELRLGILSDTGGAFENNLYQLDCFTGLFNTRAEFDNHIKDLPMFAQAYILIKK